LFTNNSALRAVLAEPLLLNMTQALITEDIDTDGDGIGNKVDEDDDGDGVADTNDVFPLDGTETVDFDGDGTGDNADNDDDNDGLEDGADAFPFDATEYLDTDGDGTGNNADTDDDNDTVEDANDAFPLDPAASVDTDNDGAPDDWNEGKSVQDSTTGLVLDTDDDNDGTLDEGDAFPLDASESRDTDLDGTGDNADTDDDNDGVEDANDAFPLDPAASVDTDADGLPDDWNEGATATDSTTNLTVDDDDDGDGVADSEDEFPLDPTRSIDTDGDGIDNAVDDDDDNDGVEDANDAFPLDPAASVDTDNDGLPDDWNEGATAADSTTGLNVDDDDDNDGVVDSEDQFPNDPSRAIDTDGDGLDDAVDDDDDNDGVLDTEDAFPDDPAASVDTDQDGLPDDWNAGFTAADSTTGLSLDNDDDNDGILDADDLFVTTADEGGYLADDLVASPFGVVRFIPGIGDDPIMLTGFENAAWQLNADGTFVAHTDDPNQAATGTWEAKANGYILSYSPSQAFGREFTSEQLRNIDRTVLATLVSDVSQPFELQVNEQWVVTLGIYLHGPLGWGVAYSTEQRVFAASDGLAIDPSAPIFKSGGGIDRNGVLPADKPTVAFAAEELPGSWLLEGLNSDAQDSDAQCNVGPCSDVLIVAADNTAQTLHSNRTATWQIDAAGTLLLTFDDTAVEYTIERFDAGPEAQTVLVRFTQGDRLYAKMSMLIAQDQPVSADLSAYYDQVLSSSYFVTAHPDRSGYRRDASDQLIDNFAFVLNSADGTGVQISVNSERRNASGLIVQPGAASSQAVAWTELNGTIEIERCYQFVADAQGNDVCALKQVRELQPVKLTAARLYVRENLTVVQDTDADGVFDFQHYVISRPNFYEITPYYDIDDFDRDGVTNELDAYPADPTQN
jgi:hypothetical protein